MFGREKIPVYCHMGNFGCGDGGWTLAMKIDGTKVSLNDISLTLFCLGFFEFLSLSTKCSPPPHRPRKVSRFSVSFDCFWDVNITTYWRLEKSQWLVENFAPFLSGSFHSKQKFKVSRQKSGQKCKLLCRLKDKGKRYSTLESMLSKRQGKTGIKTCLHLFLTVCFCRGVVVRALITGIMFLKKFWTKRSSSLRYFTCFVDFWNLTKLHKDATLNLFLWSTNLWWGKSMFW